MEDREGGAFKAVEREAGVASEVSQFGGGLCVRWC
jgi:hypothetical protein